MSESPWLVSAASVPSTRVQAKAAALFGDAIQRPGVHQLPPDREGWVWLVTVNDAERVVSLCAIPADLLDAPTLEDFFRWRDQHSELPPVALRLIG